MLYVHEISLSSLQSVQSGTRQSDGELDAEASDIFVRRGNRGARRRMDSGLDVGRGENAAVRAGGAEPDRHGRSDGQSAHGFARSEGRRDLTSKGWGTVDSERTSREPLSDLS